MPIAIKLFITMNRLVYFKMPAAGTARNNLCHADSSPTNLNPPAISSPRRAALILCLQPLCHQHGQEDEQVGNIYNTARRPCGSRGPRLWAKSRLTRPGRVSGTMTEVSTVTAACGSDWRQDGGDEGAVTTLETRQQQHRRTRLIRTKIGLLNRKIGQPDTHLPSSPIRHPMFCAAR